VRALVDRGLTTVSRVGRLLGLNKNLRRHRGPDQGGHAPHPRRSGCRGGGPAGPSVRAAIRQGHHRAPHRRKGAARLHAIWGRHRRLRGAARAETKEEYNEEEEEEDK
jgi:hypothetical protein